jgi:hypothetical protein
LASIATLVLAGSSLAGPVRSGFDSTPFPGNDDGSTAAVNIGFGINYFGNTYNSLFVNNNGNVTFDHGEFTYTPFGLTGPLGQAIIAPFFADVDTRTGNLTAYGTGTVDGHAAFGVTWPDVGYFFEHTDKLNNFQMILIDRSDTGAGNFDIEFNYNRVQWETGDASGGSGGLGGSSAHVGFSNGTGLPGTFFEFPGSGVNGAFLDSGPAGTALILNSNVGVPGRYVFSARNGALPTDITPEPATLLTFGGVLGLGLIARRRKKA